MREGFIEKNIGWILLGAMVAAGGGAWYATDSVWYAVAGASTPLVAVVGLAAYHFVSSHWENGSGVAPSGRIQWFGDDSN